MDFDSAYIEPLIEDWMDCFREAIKEEEMFIKAEDQFYMPFIGLPLPIVNTIFQISEHLDLGINVKYLTVHVYDKFMCNYFWEVYKAEIAVGPTENSWNSTCKEISSQSKLYLMSCMQLASKMESSSKSLGISQILSILCQIDNCGGYTRNMILQSEFKVFKTIGFRVPFYTPLHCIEILLVASGLRQTSTVYNTAMDLLDFSYLQHEQLYTHMQCLVQQGHLAKTQDDKKNVLALENNVIFLGASVVLCASFFLCVQDHVTNEIALKLSELTDIQDTDIWDMANVLLVMAVQE